MKAEPQRYRPESRGCEHGSYIVESLETGRVYRGHFNVINRGTITNLPDDAIVEVPGYVDHTGIYIPRVGALPLGCAAVCNASISVRTNAAFKGAARLKQKSVQELRRDRAQVTQNAAAAIAQ